MQGALDQIDSVLAAGNEPVPSPVAGVEMRRSWIRDPYSGRNTQDHPSGDPSAVDRHMQEWIDAGWTLHAVTTTLSPGVGLVDLVHTFFWRR